MKAKFVKVQFPGTFGKSYEFKTLIEVQPGDHVVVDTANGYCVAIVENVPTDCSTNFSAVRTTKWVVQKVDTDAHKALLEKEARLRKLRKEMEALRKQEEELHVYRILAEKNPEMAELLKKFEAEEGDFSADE